MNESTSREDWQEIGAVDELSRRELVQIHIKGTSIALSFREGRFHTISGACNHTGGPLGEGHLEGDRGGRKAHAMTAPGVRE